MPNLGEEDELNSNISRWIIWLVVIGVSYGSYYFCNLPRNTDIPRKPKEIIFSITLPPQIPPPPIIPPVTTPPVEQTKEEMIQQEEVKPDEAKPEDPKPDEPPAITTSIVGNGPPDGFGSGGGKGGIGNGIGGGNGHKNGSKFGWYASQVQNTISDAMRRNSKLKNSSMSIVVRIWADGTGRIIKTKLSGTTGDNVLDEVLKNDILLGLQLKESPPSDMPMPIVMRITAKR
jgi:periplasmic protein TonB